jgi:hypothetical protein
MAANVREPSLAEVKQGVIGAICMLYLHDPELLDVNANERSITHKLAEYLQRNFPSWNVDCEYNRLGHETKRLKLSLGMADPYATEAETVFPDIIIHRRLTNQNLLVIEVKKAAGTSETRDIEKLQAFTQTLEYQYEYGLFLRLRGDGNPEAELYVGGARKTLWTSDLRHALQEAGYGG